MGRAMPNPGTICAIGCTTAATMAVPSSMRPYIRKRQARYRDTSVGMIAPPTLTATRVVRSSISWGTTQVQPNIETSRAGSTRSTATV
jgi:hypothetical protein